MERDYLDYLQDIFISINEIEGFIKGMDFSAFGQDRKTVNAVIRSLEVMGEAAKKIPEDVKNQHSEIPWKSMAGIRDKLIHEYFGVDEEMVWKVASEELPPLKYLFDNLSGGK